MIEVLPPDWAIERALEQGYRGNGWTANVVKAYGPSTPLIETVLSFARYIARHENAPLDPLLIEARQLVADRYNDTFGAEHKAATLAGEDDDSDAIKNCLAALRRGIEIGEAQP